MNRSNNSTTTAFPANTRVVLHGLQKTNWNGKTGIVKDENVTKEGRQVVLVQDAKKTVAIKVSNLKYEGRALESLTVAELKQVLVYKQVDLKEHDADLTKERLQEKLAALTTSPHEIAVWLAASLKHKKERQIQYKLRLKKLEKKVKKCQSIPNISESGLKKKKVKKTQNFIPALQQNLKEAEECMELLRELDDGVPTEIFVVLGFNRQWDGIPNHVPPSEMKVLAYNMLKLARVTLAEALEQVDRCNEALPLYHKAMDQAQVMRDETWAPVDELHQFVNNLALCYKRCGEFDEAIYWYRRGFELVEQEAPCSPAKESMERNLNILLFGGTAGPAVPNANVRTCWGCGVDPETNPNIELFPCGECEEKRFATIGAYCSEECRRSDWERHKSYHGQVKDSEEIKRENNYTPVDEDVARAVEDEEYLDSASDFEKLMAEAIRFGMQGDARKKKKLVKRAIKADPSDARGPYTLALVLLESRHFVQAIENFEAAMELVERQDSDDPLWEQIWGRSAANVFHCLTNQSGCVLMERPEWMESPDQLLIVSERATHGCPDFNEAWAMMGSALEASDPGRAAECYRNAVQVSQTVQNRNKFMRKAIEAAQRTQA